MRTAGLDAEAGGPVFDEDSGAGAPAGLIYDSS